MGMDVPMESGEEEIAALREQLRQVKGRVEHLRRIGLEQSRSLAVSVPELEAAVELSLKVSAFWPPPPAAAVFLRSVRSIEMWRGLGFESDFYFYFLNFFLHNFFVTDIGMLRKLR
jgi:hypothetical protein